MPMPTITDLQGMYGDWNPQAYMQAQENAGLERQFRESQYGEQQAQTRQRELANMYSEQDQPGKMEQQRLTNQNLGYTGTGLDQKNQEAGLTLERNKAMQKYNLDADQRKALMQMTEDDFKQSDQAIEQMFRSGRPDLIKQATELQSFTKAMRDEKLKHERAVELRKMQEDAAMARQKLQSDTQYGVAKLNQDAQTARAGAKGTGGSNIAMLAKLSPDKRLGYIKGILANAIDPDTKQELSPAARAYYEAMRDQDTRTLDAKAPVASQQPIYDPVTKQLVTPAPRPSVAEKPSRESRGPVLPEGAKKIGTSKGKDVYELPDGRKVIAE